MISQQSIQDLEHCEQMIDDLLDLVARRGARGQGIMYKPEENLLKNEES